jgi:hypothetical protein
MFLSYVFHNIENSILHIFAILDVNFYIVDVVNYVRKIDWKIGDILRSNVTIISSSLK